MPKSQDSSYSTGRSGAHTTGAKAKLKKFLFKSHDAAQSEPGSPQAPSSVDQLSSTGSVSIGQGGERFSKRSKMAAKMRNMLNKHGRTSVDE